MPRMTLWLVVSLILLVVQYTTMPADPMDASRWARALVVVNKINLLTIGGWTGYWLDRAAFPYARPDAVLRQSNCCDKAFKGSYLTVFAAAMMRRALIMGATILAVALGV